MDLKSDVDARFENVSQQMSVLDTAVGSQVTEAIKGVLHSWNVCRLQMNWS